MKEDSKRDQITIVVGKKDNPGLITWARSVPCGLFSYYVIEAIEKHFMGQQYMLPSFPLGKAIPPKIAKTISFQNKPEIYKRIIEIETTLRSHYIKTILNKSLKKEDEIKEDLVILRTPTVEKDKGNAIEYELEKNKKKTSKTDEIELIEAVEIKNDVALNMLLNMTKRIEK